MLTILWQLRKKLPVAFICYRKRTGIVDELNCILNAEQRRGERLLSEKEKKRERFMMDINTVGRMTGKLEKETYPVASPPTAIQLVKGGRKGRRSCQH